MGCMCHGLSWGQHLSIVLPGEREVVINCETLVGDSKSAMETKEKTEEYSVDFKAGWLYRLELEGYDLENDRCNYSYKFTPYAPEDQEELRKGPG